MTKLFLRWFSVMLLISGLLSISGCAPSGNNKNTINTNSESYLRTHLKLGISESNARYLISKQIQSAKISAVDCKFNRNSCKGSKTLSVKFPVGEVSLFCSHSTMIVIMHFNQNQQLIDFKFKEKHLCT